MNLPRTAGGAQVWPHAAATRFLMKKGAQHTMKAENTTPSTREAFSSDWVELEILVKLF